jgi:Fe-S cluster assembly protein SufD
METYLTRSKRPVFVNSVTDIRLAAEASLELLQAFTNAPEAFNVASTRVTQAQDSRFRSFQFTDGSRLFRNNLSVLLEGEGAEASVNGLHRLKDARHADSHTFVEHIAPNAKSDQLYKAILEGEAHSVFNGKILVRREAQLTNSYQLNKNLILSREARVDTKPQLEIFADDVKCSHGATIGQLDDDQLFYLAARGITRDAAMTMLIRGFVDDVVSRISDPVLRGKLIQIMD